MLRNIMNRVPRGENEEGFTLIELLTVILILGILAAIAIPAYSKHRNEATSASLKTDLHNGATIMTAESIKTQGTFGAALPNYTDFSQGNLLSIVPESSNKDQFCLRGSNETTSKPFYYSSKSGTISESKDSCDPTESDSYATVNKDKKVLLVINAGVTHTHTVMRRSLTALGYSPENIEEVASSTLSQKNLDNVNLIILTAQFWAPADSDLSAAYDFYDKGGKVLIEGNDSNPTRFAAAGVHMSNAGPSFTPTYNQLTPAFPYSFKNEAFGTDSWRCITELKNGAVSIASSHKNGVDCITMFGASNANQGQFSYVIYATNQSKIEFSQSYAALTWMMN